MMCPSHGANWGSKHSVVSLQLLQAQEVPQAVNDKRAAYGPFLYALQLPICRAIDISMILSQMFIFRHESARRLIDYAPLQSNELYSLPQAFV